ncbi:MAG: hypothetical protein ABL921_32275, partial [Pirellula sp.]
MQPNEETLFNEALEIEDPVERAEYLRKSCDGDEALRRRIERLLMAYAHGEMLEPTLDAGPAPAQVAVGTDQIGET